MKKEMKIVLPFYKIAYAVSFVVILSLIRGVVFTNEIGLSIEAVSYTHLQGSRYLGFERAIEK